MPHSKTWEEARRRALKQAHAMTDAEDAQIKRGIAADPDTLELDDDWFAKAKPGRGRPAKAADERLKQTGIRLKPETVERYKVVVGRGFQNEMRKGIELHLEELVAQAAKAARSARTTTGSGARKGRANKAAARASRHGATKSNKRP